MLATMRETDHSTPRPAVRLLSCAAASLALLAAACGGGDRTGDSAAAAPRADSAASPAPAAAPSAPAVARGRWTNPCLRVTEDAAAVGRDTVCFRDERSWDAAGDGHPFTIAVEGRGPRQDSMNVVLRITRGDTVFHRATFNTVMYGRYDAAPAAADSARRRTEHQLGRLLADSAFRPTAELLGGAGDRDRAFRDVVAFDVSVAEERRRRRLGPTARLPESVRQSPKPTTDTARVRALATELRDRPAFRYFAGGEATYAVAWSPTERRFVVVYSCC